MKEWNGKVPDWELEPVDGVEQKEAQENAVEEMPSVAETRMAELATETHVVTPENPEEKAAQIEARLAEIRAFSHPETKSLLDQKTENLKRRMSGEIDGVELDRLDREIDEKIKKNGEDNNHRFSGLDRKTEKTEKGKVFEDDLKNSWDLRQVMHSIQRFGDITAPDGYVYKADYLIPLIGNLKDSNDPNLQRVTNNYGLRDRVRELLSQTRV